MINMKFLLLVFACIFVGSIDGQRPTKSTTTSTQKSTTPIPMNEWIDPHVGGKYGNPGANVHLSDKALDQLHAFVIDRLGQRLQSMNTSDLQFPFPDGNVLVVKSPKFTESKFPKYEKELLPPNRIRSRFFNGRMVIEGEWEYKSSKPVRIFGHSRSFMSGTFKTTIVDVELETLVQLARSTENKPIVNLIDCRANLSNFRVDVKGAGDLTVIENCNDAACNKVCLIFLFFVC